MMSLPQALHKAIDGYAVMRKGCLDQAYVHYKSSIGMMLCSHGGVTGSFRPSKQDRDATDWVTVGEDFFNHQEK